MQNPGEAQPHTQWPAHQAMFKRDDDNIPSISNCIGSHCNKSNLTRVFKSIDRLLSYLHFINLISIFNGIFGLKTRSLLYSCMVDSDWCDKSTFCWQPTTWCVLTSFTHELQAVWNDEIQTHILGSYAGEFETLLCCWEYQMGAFVGLHTQYVNVYFS